MANPLYKEGVSDLSLKGFNQGQSEVCVQPCTYKEQSRSSFEFEWSDEEGNPLKQRVLQLNMSAIAISQEDLFAKYPNLVPGRSFKE